MKLLRLLRPSDALMASLRGGALAGLLARGVSMVGAFAMSVAIMRSLPASDAGLVLLVYTLLTMAATLGRFGADNLALREVSRRPEEAGAVVRNSFLVCVLMAPLAALILVGALLLREHVAGAGSVAVAAAAAVFPASLSFVAGAVLRGLGRVAAGTLAELGSPLALAAIGIATAGAMHEVTALSAVWMITGGYAVTAIWAWTFIGRLLPFHWGDGLAGFFRYLRRFRVSLASFFMTTMGFFLLSWMPVLALGYFIADHSSAQSNVALFNAGARLSQFVILIPTVQISYLSQRFAKLHHDGDLRQLNVLSQSATKIAVITATPLALMLVLAPGIALKVFGGYGDAALTLQILAVGALLVAMAGPVNGLMLTCGHEIAAGRFTMVLVIVSVIILPLLARWGSAGVAVGSVTVSLLYALLCFITLHRAGIHAAIAARSDHPVNEPLRS
jgi:O-antigen/teichoic acid export membrane protein